MRTSLRIAAFAAVVLVLCPAAASAWVYWGNYGNGSTQVAGGVGTTIGRADLDGGSVTPNFIGNADFPSAVASDGTTLFWGNYGRGFQPFFGTIGRALVDGSQATQSFTPAACCPTGVAVNATHVFWTDAADRVSRVNRDGTGANIDFIPSAGTSSCGVAINATHIYWAWTDGAGGHIARANLDGTGVNKNFIDGATSPCGVAVTGTHVFWANMGNGGTGTTIGRATLAGGAVNQSFITGASGPCGVAVDGSQIYWANNGPNGTGTTIGRANLDGAGVNQSFITGASGPCGVAVDALEPPPPSAGPTVQTLAATEVTTTSARIQGTVNPNNAVTHYHFEWGESAAYGNRTPTADARVGSDATVHQLDALVGGLQPDTEYHFRIVASNANGTSHGAGRTVVTRPEPPVPQVTDVVDITQSSATLRGRVDPRTQVTQAWFTVNGSKTGETFTIPARVEPREISATLTGLKDFTEYTVRVVAESKGGLVESPPRVFRTYEAPIALPDGDRIAYSLNGDIYVAKLDGTGIRKITRWTGPGCRKRAPKLSPDSSRVAYVHECQLGLEVRVVDIDGGHDMLIDKDRPGSGGADSHAEWSADGQALVYPYLEPITTRGHDSPSVRRRFRLAVFVPGSRRVAASPLLAGLPDAGSGTRLLRWAADGRIAYTAFGGQVDIYDPRTQQTRVLRRLSDAGARAIDPTLTQLVTERGDFDLYIGPNDQEDRFFASSVRRFVPVGVRGSGYTVGGGVTFSPAGQHLLWSSGGFLWRHDIAQRTPAVMIPIRPAEADEPSWGGSHCGICLAARDLEVDAPTRTFSARSSRQDVGFTNDGARTLTFGTATATGAFSVDRSKGARTARARSSCERRTLKPGQSCSIRVRFRDRRAGVTHGALLPNIAELPSKVVGLEGKGRGAAPKVRRLRVTRSLKVSYLLTHRARVRMVLAKAGQCTPARCTPPVHVASAALPAAKRWSGRLPARLRRKLTKGTFILSVSAVGGRGWRSEPKSARFTRR